MGTKETYGATASHSTWNPLFLFHLHVVIFLILDTVGTPKVERLP